MAQPGKKKQKQKHHNKCGKKCERNKGLRSWPLMPDGLTVDAAWRWYNNRYSK